MRALVLTLLFALAPMATAQPLSADHPTLYPHYGDGRWQNTISPDPDATQSSSGSNPLGIPLGLAGGTIFDYSWHYPMQEALADDLTLDSAGTVDVELHVIYYLTYGATVPTPASVDVSWKLADGNLLIAEGEAKNVAPLGDTSPAIVQWSVAPSIDVIPAGTTPTLTVRAEGPALNYWMETEDPTKSRTTLPIFVEPAIEPVLPQTFYTDLDGPVLDVNQTQGAASIDTHVYNWTQGPARTNITYAVEVQTGNTSLLVTDAAGTELVNRTFMESGTETLHLEPTEAGDWQVTWSHNDFSGNASIQISPLPEDVEGEPTATGPTNTATRTATATDTATPDEAADEEEEPAVEESPNAAIGLLLAGTLLLARRRRGPNA